MLPNRNVEPFLPPFLEACQLGRRAPGGDHWLLRGVDLRIVEGERIAIVGPTGAGKSVLLRALALLDPVDEGVIHWRGHPVRGEAIPGFRSQVVYLHQRPALIDDSVEANLREPYSLKVHHNRRYDPSRILELLESLGRRAGFLEKRPHHLSGGETQIVALVRALQLDPAILLLDESTSALDRDTARMAESLLQSWHSQGGGRRTLIWVTHDPDQVDRIADRRITIQAGQILHADSPR